MKISKILAVLVCISMLLSFTACSGGKDASWVYDIGGEKISSGLYLLSQQQSMSSAISLVQEEFGQDASNDFMSIATDLDSYEIEDKPAKEWIEENILKTLKQYAVINNLVKENNIIIPVPYVQSAMSSAEEQFTTYKDSFEYYGIGQDSIEEATLFEYKLQVLYENLFTGKGKYAPSEDEIKSYFEENYGYAFWYNSYIEGYSEEDAKAVEEKFDEFVDALNNGEDFGKSLAEYELFFDEYYEKYNEEENATESGEQPDGQTSSTDDTTEENDNLEDMDDINDHSAVILKEDKTSVVPAQILESIWSQDEDTDVFVKIKTDDGSLNVVKRRELFSNEDNLEKYRESILARLANDKMPDLFEELGDSYSIETNDSALKKYKVDDLVKKLLMAQQSTQQQQSSQVASDEPSSSEEAQSETAEK